MEIPVSVTGKEARRRIELAANQSHQLSNSHFDNGNSAPSRSSSHEKIGSSRQRSGPAASNVGPVSSAARNLVP